MLSYLGGFVSCLSVVNVRQDMNNQQLSAKLNPATLYRLKKDNLHKRATTLVKFQVVTVLSIYRVL